MFSLSASRDISLAFSSRKAPREGAEGCTAAGRCAGAKLRGRRVIPFTPDVYRLISWLYVCIICIYILSHYHICIIYIYIHISLIVLHTRSHLFAFKAASLRHCVANCLQGHERFACDAGSHATAAPQCVPQGAWCHGWCGWWCVPDLGWRKMGHFQKGHESWRMWKFTHGFDGTYSIYIYTQYMI